MTFRYRRGQLPGQRTVQPFISICNNKTGFRTLTVTDLDKLSDPQLNISICNT